MSYFDIQGYEPQYLIGRSEIIAAHGQRLRALTGHRLRHAWLLWDGDEDEWFVNGPVLLDFGADQVEINHSRFCDLSITWNTVTAAGQAPWSFGWDEEPLPYRVQLGWRDDARPELAELHGQRLQSVELLEWKPYADMADGMVAVSFVFPCGRVTVCNALDENGLEFGEPDSRYRRHPLSS